MGQEAPFSQQLAINHSIMLKWMAQNTITNPKSGDN